MEVAPFFERRLCSPSTQYPMQNTAHSSDTGKKEFDTGSLQLPSWQIDHNRYYCNQNTPNHCSHRYSTATVSTSSELQAHSSTGWHPFAYDTSDAFLTSRTNDVVPAYHGLDPRISSSRSTYSITPNLSISPISHAHPTLSNSYHRPIKTMEDPYQVQHSPFHRINGAYTDAIVDAKKDWELSFMRGMPYCKFCVFFSLFSLSRHDRLRRVVCRYSRFLSLVKVSKKIFIKLMPNIFNLQMTLFRKWRLIIFI